MNKKSRGQGFSKQGGNIYGLSGIFGIYQKEYRMYDK